MQFPKFKFFKHDKTNKKNSNYNPNTIKYFDDDEFDKEIL